MAPFLRSPVFVALLVNAYASGASSDAFDEDSLLQAGARFFSSKKLEEAREAVAAARREAMRAHQAHEASEDFVAEKAAEASHYAAGMCGPSGGCEEETTLLQAAARSVKRQNKTAEEAKEAIAAAKRAFAEAHKAHDASEDLAAEKAAEATQYVSGPSICSTADACTEETALLQAGLRTVKRHNKELEEAQEALTVAKRALAGAQEAYEASKDAVAEAAEKVVVASRDEADPATGVCPRPEGFCLHPGSTFVDDMDCDGDCIPDPYCRDDEEQTGFYGSASACASTWPAGACAPADPAKCAETTAAELVACPRPSAFCTHAGAVFDDSKDCDGDGIADPFCYDEEEQSGFYGSANGCESTWPEGSCDTEQAARKQQDQERVLRNLLVVSGAFSVVLVGLTVHSYLPAAGAAAVAA